MARLFDNPIDFLKLLKASKAAQIKQGIPYMPNVYGVIQSGNRGYLIAESVSREIINQAPITAKYGSNVVSIRDGVNYDKLQKHE